MQTATFMKEKSLEITILNKTSQCVTASKS